MLSNFHIPQIALVTKPTTLSTYSVTQKPFFNNSCSGLSVHQRHTTVANPLPRNVIAVDICTSLDEMVAVDLDSFVFGQGSSRALKSFSSPCQPHWPHSSICCFDIEHKKETASLLKEVRFLDVLGFPDIVSSRVFVLIV